MSEVTVRDVHKTYPLYRTKADKLKEAFSISRRKYHTDFEALKGVSLEVERGECVGIIGLNGSGKSTLLKILTNIISPTSGTVKVNGKISALLELGAGFNPDYTGIENIYLNTLLMGMTREETNHVLPEIIDFADIGEYIYQPVKFYSSGMYVRLAFSIAAMVSPDVLIIDEALSVGDVFFQQKCYQKIRELAQNATVLIVSHDLNALVKFCKRIIVLNNGVKIFDGDSHEAITEYLKVRQGQMSHANHKHPEVSYGRYVVPRNNQYSGKQDIIINSYYYTIDGVEFGEYCRAGSYMSISMIVSSKMSTDNLIVGYQIRDKFGQEVFGETNITSDITNDTKIIVGHSRLDFSFTWPEVREGDYFITLGIGTGYEVLNQIEQCWINEAIHVVNSADGKLIYGIFNNPMDGFRIEGLSSNER